MTIVIHQFLDTELRLVLVINVAHRLIEGVAVKIEIDQLNLPCVSE